MEMTPDTTDFNSLSKKQLVELVIAKYNDCFRLEEENKKLKEEREMLIEDLSSDKELQQQIAQKQREYYEENKKLKEKIELLDNENMCLNAEIKDRKEENKKLKYVIDTLMEKTCIDHITLTDGEMFVNPSKRLRLSDDFEKCGK